MSRNQLVIIPEEVIMNKIYFIRGHKVMVDKDLAELYGVETKRLKEQVKRNKIDLLNILCLNLQSKRMKF
jgi:hypothetical protein